MVLLTVMPNSSILNPIRKNKTTRFFLQRNIPLVHTRSPALACLLWCDRRVDGDPSEGEVWVSIQVDTITSRQIILPDRKRLEAIVDAYEGALPLTNPGDVADHIVGVQVAVQRLLTVSQ